MDVAASAARRTSNRRSSSDDGDCVILMVLPGRAIKQTNRTQTFSSKYIKKPDKRRRQSTRRKAKKTRQTVSKQTVVEITKTALNKPNFERSKVPVRTAKRSASRAGDRTSHDSDDYCIIVDEIKSFEVAKEDTQLNVVCDRRNNRQAMTVNSKETTNTDVVQLQTHSPQPSSKESKRLSKSFVQKFILGTRESNLTKNKRKLHSLNDPKAAKEDRGGQNEDSACSSTKKGDLDSNGSSTLSGKPHTRANCGSACEQRTSALSDGAEANHANVRNSCTVEYEQSSGNRPPQQHGNSTSNHNSKLNVLHRFFLSISKLAHLHNCTDSLPSPAEEFLVDTVVPPSTTESTISLSSISWADGFENYGDSVNNECTSLEEDCQSVVSDNGSVSEVNVEGLKQRDINKSRCVKNTHSCRSFSELYQQAIRNRPTVDLCKDVICRRQVASGLVVPSLRTGTTNSEAELCVNRRDHKMQTIRIRKQMHVGRNYDSRDALSHCSKVRTASIIEHTWNEFDSNEPFPCSSNKKDKQIYVDNPKKSTSGALRKMELNLQSPGKNPVQKFFKTRIHKDRSILTFKCLNTKTFFRRSKGNKFRNYQRKLYKQ